jgi:hypothetical protein
LAVQTSQAAGFSPTHHPFFNKLFSAFSAPLAWHRSCGRTGAFAGAVISAHPEIVFSAPIHFPHLPCRTSRWLPLV